jgi:peroxiredoxin
MKRKHLFYLPFVLLFLTYPANAQLRTGAVADTTEQFYMKLAGSTKPDDRQTVKEAIRRYGKSKTEKGILLAASLADRINEANLADSLTTVAAARFPYGNQAKSNGYNALLKRGTAAEKLEMYKKWIKKFPEPRNNTDIVYDYARTALADAYVKKRNVKQAMTWIDLIKNGGYKSVAEFAEGQAFLEQGDTVTAEVLIHRSLLTAKANLASNPDPGAKGQYEYYLQFYASLLYKQQKYKEALHYIQEAGIDTTNKSGAPKTLYALILTANGQGKEVLPVLEETVKGGNAGSDVTEALKTAYIQDKGSSDGYDAYLYSLKELMNKNVRERVAKQMIGQEAPSFTLLDLDGKQISLDSLKGKIVILDFWATWCGPCKRSFPAMQMTVNKYKDDPNVKFLFVDTWERIPDASKDVSAFITENKYSFQVLLDTKATGVVNKFGIQTIPAKFIIDGNGKIRFKLSGFSGSNEAAVQELSAMIDMIKNPG